MSKHTTKHRHFVILPVAALVTVGLSFASSFASFADLFPAVQSNISATETQQEFSLESGVYGVLYSGFIHPKEDVLHLDYGAAALATDGILRMEIGDIGLVTLDGTVYVSVDELDMTVAAMTAPVYVTLGKQRTVVPAGMQWKLVKRDGLATLQDGFEEWFKTREPTVLPKSFTHRKAADLAAVTKPKVSLPKMYQDVPAGSSTLLQLLLPVSAEKQLKKQHEKALGALHFVVEQGNTQALEEVLADPLVQVAIDSPYGQSTLVRLVAGRDTSVRMLLLQQLVQHESIWAVTSAHETYASVVWSIFEPETSVEAQLTRVFMLPFVAQTAQEFPQYIFERHRAAVQGILPNVADKEAFVEHMLAAHVPAVYALETLQYPMRARALRSTLLSLIDSALQQTARMREAEQLLQQLDRVVIEPLPPKSAQEVTASVLDAMQAEPEQQYTADEAEAKAYAMLTEAGALFSVQSAVAAFAPNQVRVSDLLFSTGSEDRTVSFILNVATEHVTDITVNGDGDFPYSPTFEGFVTWIRK